MASYNLLSSVSGDMPILGFRYTIVACDGESVVFYNHHTASFITRKLVLDYRDQFYFYYEHKRFYLSSAVVDGILKLLPDRFYTYIGDEPKSF